jgi:hypothetical protein
MFAGHWPTCRIELALLCSRLARSRNHRSRHRHPRRPKATFLMSSLKRPAHVGPSRSIVRDAAAHSDGPTRFEELRSNHICVVLFLAVRRHKSPCARTTRCPQEVRSYASTATCSLIGPEVVRERAGTPAGRRSSTAMLPSMAGPTSAISGHHLVFAPPAERGDSRQWVCGSGEAVRVVHAWR